MIKAGNIGVLTHVGQELHEVTGVQNGLVYCVPMTGARVVRVCLPDQFWVLLDSMP